MASMGSSPLTRGKRTRSSWRVRGVRLIPAHAGKTVATSRRTQAKRAHPRSRGENPRHPVTQRLGLGSSPLTRGKPGREPPQRPRTRLIPAHAGKTTPPPTQPATSPAHPRSRGENVRPRPMIVCGVGSSPLTRGKRRWGAPTSDARGLIPAHAGKTRQRGP